MKLPASFPLVLLLLAACGADAPERVDLAACVASPTCPGGLVYVADEIDFAMTASDGTLPGFDLDDFDSIAGEYEGCGVADSGSGDGDVGVDNRLGSLLADLPQQILEIVPGVVQSSINAGTLLFLTELVPLDAGRGYEWGAVFRFGTGVPLLGTDDRLLPDQTFALDPDPLLGYVEDVRKTDRGLEGGPFDLRFRMHFLATPLAFTLQRARFRFVEEDDGSLRGVVGGAVSMEDVFGLLDLLGGDDTALREALKSLLPPLADIRSPETGDCDALSAAVEVHAVPAFIFGE